MGRISTDRFGNERQIIRLKEVVDKKTGQIIPEVYQGYFQVGKKVMKVRVTHNNKEYPDGRNSKWMEITATSLQPRDNNSGGRQGGGRF